MTEPIVVQGTSFIELSSIKGSQGSQEANVNSSTAEITPKPEKPSGMTVSYPLRTKHRLLSATMWEFTLGMSDSVLGALLPSIERYYGVSYAVVSLVWLGNALGFITIAFTGHYLDDFLGKRLTACLSCALVIAGCSILASGLRVFGVIVFAFFLCGLGGAIGAAQFNLFLSKMQDSSKYMGAFHGFYGIGGVAAPLLGTLMVNKQGYEAWHYFYLIPLGMQLFTLGNMWWSFQDAEDLEPFYAEDDEDDSQSHDFKAALMNIKCWITCAFVFFYQGAEVSMGGWVVTFLLNYRAGSDSTGYVAAGFWAGVTLGRFILSHPMTKYFGVRRSVLVLAVLCMLFDLLVWLVPNVIAAGTFAAIIGFFVGPMYPMMISLITQILPRKIKFCAITLATAFGSSGASAIPFFVGLASEFAGTFVLHPIFLACFVSLIVAWLLLPNIERKGGNKNIWQRLW